MERELVRLSVEDQELALECGRQVYNRNVEEQMYMKPIRNDVHQVWHYVFGAGSELAVHRYFDMDFHHRTEDFMIVGDIEILGRTLEIKCVWKKNNDVLRIPQWQREKQVDGYLLINKIRGLESWELVGWVPHDVFWEKCEMTTYSGHERDPMYTMHRSKLWSVRDLRIELWT